MTGRSESDPIMIPTAAAGLTSAAESKTSACIAAANVVIVEKPLSILLLLPAGPFACLLLQLPLTLKLISCVDRLGASSWEARARLQDLLYVGDAFAESGEGSTLDAFANFREREATTNA